MGRSKSWISLVGTGSNCSIELLDNYIVEEMFLCM